MDLEEAIVYVKMVYASKNQRIIETMNINLQAYKEIIESQQERAKFDAALLAGLQATKEGKSKEEFSEAIDGMKKVAAPNRQTPPGGKSRRLRLIRGPQ